MSKSKGEDAGSFTELVILVLMTCVRRLDQRSEMNLLEDTIMGSSKGWTPQHPPIEC